MWPAIMILTFASVAILSSFLIPPLFEKAVSLSQKKSQKMADRMDNLAIKVKPRRLATIYVLAPFLFGGIGYIFYPQRISIGGIDDRGDRRIFRPQCLCQIGHRAPPVKI